MVVYSRLMEAGRWGCGRVEMCMIRANEPQSAVGCS